MSSDWSCVSYYLFSHYFGCTQQYASTRPCHFVSSLVVHCSRYKPTSKVDKGHIVREQRIWSIMLEIWIWYINQLLRGGSWYWCGPGILAQCRKYHCCAGWCWDACTTDQWIFPWTYHHCWLGWYCWYVTPSQERPSPQTNSLILSCSLHQFTPKQWHWSSLPRNPSKLDRWDGWCSKYHTMPNCSGWLLDLPLACCRIRYWLVPFTLLRPGMGRSIWWYFD